MNDKEKFIYLRGVAAGMSIVEELHGFGRTVTPEETTMNRSKVEPRVKSRRVKGKKRRWTEEEKQTLKDNLELSNTELHNLLPNRSASNIAAMKSYLGLKREKKEEVDNGLAKLNQ